MTVDVHTREEPREVLQQMEVHSKWVDHFRGKENEPFYNLAFDFIADKLGASSPGPVIDAGCGSGTKSMHLARRGYRVIGIDISESILHEARKTAAQAGVGSRVELRCADLTAIDMPAQSASRIICWGVLMHVPAIEKAVSELARILAPGGTLIISEGNMRSVQAVGLRTLKRLLGKERAELIPTPAGIEFWEETSSGRFMTRQADIPWLIREFERHGLQLEQRQAGQFTEIFMLLPWKFARQLVHGFNNLWFRVLPWAAPAYGNLLVLRRPPAR
ncbi:MAG: class I SAM-dependent methyltransferase [Pseudomonadota bacterium]|nr:class I SAM-dependent methyltransferase [Pseudomonadota bacterium]